MIVPKERAARPPQAIALNKLLLVEGETPSHFFEAFATNLGISESIEIRSYGGKDQLATYLRTIAAGSDFRTSVASLGIIRDSEDDPGAAKQSVESAIMAANIRSNVEVKVALLPDDSTPGMIETLCLKTIEGLPVLECIENLVACLEAKELPLTVGIIRAKHVAQIYLATLKEAQMFPGVAAYRGAWPFDHSALDTLRAFLRSL